MTAVRDPGGVSSAFETGRWARAGLQGAVFVAVTVWIWRRPINHDSAFLLLVGERLLDGLDLYRDQVVPNPPLGPWLHAGMMAMQRAMADAGLPALGIQVLVPGVLALCLIAMALGTALLSRSETLDRRARGWLPLGLFLVLAALPLRDFGQRDHLFAVAALPYAVLVGLRLDGVRVSRGLALMTGSFGFLGVALKPHFLLLPLVLELAVLWRRRSWRAPLRPESLALGGLLAGYAGLVAVLYPHYFTDVLPLYARVFWAYTRPFEELMLMPETILFLIAAGAWVRTRPARALGAAPQCAGLIGAAILAALAATAIFLLQKKGWTYQRAPSLIFSTWFLVLLLAQCPPAAWRRGRAWVGAGLGLVLMVVALRVVTTTHEARVSLARQIAAASDGRPVYVFTSNVSVPYPWLLYEGVTPASRFNTLWMLPALARARMDDPTALADVDRFARDAIYEDFQRHQPGAVVIDQRQPKPYFDGIDFDYMAWASQDPRFARIWSRYTLERSVFGFAIHVRDTRREPTKEQEGNHP